MALNVKVSLFLSYMCAALTPNAKGTSELQRCTTGQASKMSNVAPPGDSQVCCLRDDLIRRVDEVVIPSGRGFLRLNKGVLLNNVADHGNGHYACIALLTGDRKSSSLNKSMILCTLASQLSTQLEVQRCRAEDSCNATCRCPSGMHAEDGVWRCTDFKSIQLQLNVWDQYGQRFDHGDRVMVASGEHLILKYQFVTYADATLTEQLRGNEWTVHFPANRQQQRHSGTLILWNVTSNGEVMIRVDLHTRPAISQVIRLLYLAVSNHSVESECLEDVECRAVSALCLGRRCRCSFAFNLNGTCVKGCKTAKDCAGNRGTVCKASLCQCQNGSILVGGKCFQQECESHYECGRVRPHAVCYKSVCICKHGYRELDGACAPLVCRREQDCRDSSMRCVEGSCTCPAALADHGISCETKRRTCVSFSNCTNDTTACVGGTCLCHRGFVFQNRKCIPVMESSQCFLDADCMHSELCANRDCYCSKTSGGLPGFCQLDDRGTNTTGSSAGLRMVLTTTVGIGIFLVGVATLVLGHAYFSRKEDVEHSMMPRSVEGVRIIDQWRGERSEQEIPPYQHNGGTGGSTDSGTQYNQEPI
ncbi:uncharacterized protein ISCGN_012707 [Ixodes scapularis]